MLRITVCGACEGTGILGYLMSLGFREHVFLWLRQYVEEFTNLKVDLVHSSELNKKARRFCLRHFKCTLT